MRNKSARNLWGKEAPAGPAGKSIAAERRTRAAAARKKMASTAPQATGTRREQLGQAETEEHSGDSSKGFLGSLVRDVLYIEESIPESMRNKPRRWRLPKLGKKKDADTANASRGLGAVSGTEGKTHMAKTVRLKDVSGARSLKPSGGEGENIAAESSVSITRSAPRRKPVSPARELAEPSSHRLSSLKIKPKEVSGQEVPEELEAKRARKRLSPALRKTLLVATLLLSLAAMLWIYTTTGVLNVKHIEISGNDRLDADYLRGLSGITADDHLLKMDVKAVEQALLSEPYVAEAHISRKFPNTVAIAIVERKPEGIISQNGKYYLVDQEGRVLEGLDKKPQGLLEIQGLDLPLLFAGQQIETEGFDTIAVLLQNMPDQLKSITTSIGYKEGEGLYLQAKGTKVIYGQSSDLSKKSEVALLALNDLMTHYRAVDYIDVSYPEHPVIKPIN